MEQEEEGHHCRERESDTTESGQRTNLGAVSISTFRKRLAKLISFITCRPLYNLKTQFINLGIKICNHQDLKIGIR